MTIPGLMLSMLVGALIAMPAAADPLQMPPPIVDISAPRSVAGPRQVFILWRVQDVRCAGVPIAFTRAPAVMPVTSWWTPSAATKPIAYSFTIDPTGRPLDIARLDKGYAAGVDDLSPALAVSQFPAGVTRRDCSLTFIADAQPIATTPVASVMAYTMLPQQRPTAEMWARVKPANSTCFDPVPEVRTRAFPDFDAIPRQRGRQGWSMIGFDIDATGKPVHPKPVAGTGNAALDAASVKAVADSRFAPGARTGCQYPYRIGAATLSAPWMPEEAGFRPVDATCPIKPQWAVEPVLTYPDNFRRRSIEGWAVIAYDVAPWGATGNIRVLAAQPAEQFGEQAVRLIANAKRVPSTTGYTGCVDRVQFRMGPTRRAPGAPPLVFDPPQPAY